MRRSVWTRRLAPAVIPLVVVVIVLVTVPVIVLVVPVVAGDSRRTSGDERPTRVRPVTTAAPPAPTTTTRGAFGSGQPVTLAFGGDVHFEGTLRTKLTANPRGMFSPIAPVLGEADIAMVNLETAITERGSPEPKQYTFRAPARAFDALHAAGVDVVTMANNHGLDFGSVGMQDSLAAMTTSGYPVVGIGATPSQAYAPWRTEIRGQRIAVFGATDVLDGVVEAAWTVSPGHGGLASAKGPNLPRLLDAIRAARPSSDTVVVYVHWGVEGATCPSTRQREVAQALVGAGADVIVGSHSHRVMSAGRLGGALVAYGLGNFAFYNEAGPSGTTGVLEVTVTGRRVDRYTWKPARIQGGVPRPLAGGAASGGVTAWNAARACTGLAS